MPDPSAVQATLPRVLTAGEFLDDVQGRSTPRRPSGRATGRISRLGSMTASPVRSSSSSSGNKSAISFYQTPSAPPAPPSYRRARVGLLMPALSWPLAWCLLPGAASPTSPSTAANAKPYGLAVATCRSTRYWRTFSVTSPDYLMQEMPCQLAAAAGGTSLTVYTAAMSPLTLMIVVVQDPVMDLQQPDGFYQPEGP